MQIIRRYWSAPRMTGVGVIREVWFKGDAPDSPVVALVPLSGLFRVYAAGVVRRGQRDFPTRREAVRYAAKMSAQAPATLWGKGAPARKAEQEWMTANG